MTKHEYICAIADVICAMMLTTCCCVVAFFMPAAASPDAAPMIRADGLYKTYLTGRRPVEVLRGVDLTIHRGDFMALRGASGADSCPGATSASAWA